MRPLASTLISATLALAFSPLCPAQTSTAAETIVLPALPDTYVPTAPDNEQLYQALGGEKGIQALTDVFITRLLADPRSEPFFRDADHPLLKQQLAVMLCEVSGGPCKREKHNIKRVHSGMDIARSHFNAVVEVLQQSMDAQHIPFSAQNRLLAQLAPMHRDIVNVN